MNQLVPVQQTNAEIYRASTDAAGLCREIVLKTAMEIQGRKYVRVEGWQALAIAHGCTAGARDVEAIDGGVRAIGEVRRMSDGGLIATAEGFVGADEPTWYGGEVSTKYGKKTLPKRPDYAIRAMAQTRAISRACRSAFAHVVVMIDANLSTTPAEEVPHGGFNDDAIEGVATQSEAPREQRRERQSVTVTAALTSITSAETREELTEWLDANEPKFPEMFTKPELAIVERAYGVRWAALEAEEATFRSEPAKSVANSKPDNPKDEFADLADEIPF